MRRVALGLVLCAAAGAGFAGWSCSAKNVVVDVPIVAYVPSACGNASGAQVTYTGLGDFPQPTAASQVVTLGSSGLTLTALPSATREVVISPITHAAPWTGTALVPEAGPIEVLTLPLDTACTLSRSTMLEGNPGTSIGLTGSGQALLMGGPLPPFVIDLGTGKISQFATALDPPLSYATITPFGAGALIAGGQYQGALQEFALLYAPGPGGSPEDAGAKIALPRFPRTQHSAVTLPDGRVLLIGGVSSMGQANLDIDLFDPKNPAQPPTFLNATLHVGRIQPTVLSLPNGQVFIGGGLDPGTPGNTVMSVEWLDANLDWLGLQPLCGAAPTPASSGSAPTQGFAPTEGGAVLAVMSVAATQDCSNVQLIRPWGSGVTDGGAASAVAQQAPPIDPPPASAILLEGAQASPVLIAGSSVLRWNPWTSVFTPFASTGSSLPTATFLSASSGLAMWLGGDGNVWMLRFDTHGEYATDTLHGPYLATDDEYTSPDRLLLDAGFNPVSGATLTNGTTVWVTDETFEAVTASVKLAETGAATLVLRDPTGREVTCGATGVSQYATLQVVRTGASVSATSSDGTGVTCAGAVDAGARVAVGVRGPDGGTTSVRALAVVR